MKNIESEIASFLDEWLVYTANLNRFCVAFNLLEDEDMDYLKILTTIEDKYDVSTKLLFSSAYKLREKLFYLDENELNVGPYYNWKSLKLLFPHIESIGYLTPFSYAIYWSSIPQLIDLYNEKGLGEAIYISDDFIENLTFKYPNSLKNFRRD